MRFESLEAMDTRVISHKPLKGAAKASRRAWDLAASVGVDWTAGVRLARSAEETFQVQDVVRVRGGPEQVVQVTLLQPIPPTLPAIQGDDHV